MSNNEIDIALGCADSNFTKESATGVLAAEVRRLREENAAPAVPAPSVPDVLIQLRDKLAKISRRTEYLGGQQFAYVRLCEVVGEIEALLQSAPQAPAVPDEWREVMTELAADVQAACDAEHPHRDQYPSVMRKYNNDMKIVEKARALLQSAQQQAAPSVPQEWRDVITELADDLSIELDMRYQSRSHYPSELRKYENEMQPVYRASALLQSADKPVVPLSGQEFDDLAYRILSLALNNGTREAFPGKLQKLLMEVTRAKQS